MPITARNGRAQRRIGEAGSAATEHVGILILVGAVVAALLVVEMPPAISSVG